MARRKELRAMAREEMPMLVLLEKPQEAPKDRKMLLEELERLEAYFGALRGQYAVMRDLRKLRKTFRPPRFLNWILIGLAAGVACGAALSALLPPVVYVGGVLCWGATTITGFVIAFGRYEKRRNFVERDLRLVENDLRIHYNLAPGCFLPFPWTAPSRIERLLAYLRREKDKGLSDALQEMSV